MRGISGTHSLLSGGMEQDFKGGFRVFSRAWIAYYENHEEYLLRSIAGIFEGINDHAGRHERLRIQG